MERKTQVLPEQIEQARRLDLLSYLQQYEPHELVRVSNGVYSTHTNDSLKISRGKWFRWSTGVGGVSALDYLVKVRDMVFVDAVLHLCDCMRFEPPERQFTPKPPPPLPFALPKPNDNNDRVIEYLTQRGIGSAILHYCIQTGRLYEDERHNCCFVGFDPRGVPRYAMLRSSAPSSTFLREVEGSDKRYSFSFPPQARSNTLYLFESAIDLLSFLELRGRGNRTDNYLSLSGVYQPREELSETPLPIALMQFLQDNPHINHVALCLDNDAAGRKAIATIRALLPVRYTTEPLPPTERKDYNDQLRAEKHIESFIKTRGAKGASYHMGGSER